MGLATRGFICQACGISVLPGPAIFFENVLNVDQLAGIFGHVEANGVGRGAFGKLFAAMPAKPHVADFAQACFIGLKGASRSAALARERVA